MAIRRALLVAALDTLDAPRHLDPAIAAAATATADTLVVVLFVPAPAHWAQVQTLLAHVYVQAAAQHNPLLDVSVLLNSDVLPPAIDICFRVHDGLALPAALASVPHAFLPSHPRPSPSPTPHIRPSPRYPVVALGGTFDHLHAGHKILLSMAAWIASRKVIVGVTGTPPAFPLLSRSPPSSRRASHEEITPTTPRVIPHQSGKDTLLSHALPSRSRVRACRPPRRVRPDWLRPRHPGPGRQQGNPLGGSCQYVSLPLLFCPHLSPVDKERARKGLPALQTCAIDVISSDSSNLDHEDAEILKQTKMSSTFIREWIASNAHR
jgi:hypothetical protein